MEMNVADTSKSVDPSYTLSRRILSGAGSGLAALAAAPTTLRAELDELSTDWALFREGCFSAREKAAAVSHYVAGAAVFLAGAYAVAELGGLDWKNPLLWTQGLSLGHELLYTSSERYRELLD